MTKVLITGITGQDGAYLARELLAKGYDVVGTVRRGSTPKTGRLERLGITDKVKLVSMELTEFANVISVLRLERPDYIYNLGAQSFVADSFEHPHLTSDINYHGLLNILEAIKIEGLDCSMYQASTSEMYGDVLSNPQNEDTPFNPMSPYAVAKAAAHYLGRNYRAAYGMKVSNGILFNHESELRGREFVTRKITSQLAMIREKDKPAVRLGNLDSVRDWGYAPDYVKGMIMINEAKVASDYVIATNTVTTVREFFNSAAIAAGFVPEFEGEGINERCICQKTNKVLCKVDKKYFRPSDVNYLRGDYSKIERELGWRPTTSLEAMTEKMMASDVELARSDQLFGF
jgi:GDPmannose 4,6-dehydratase